MRILRCKNEGGFASIVTEVLYAMDELTARNRNCFSGGWRCQIMCNDGNGKELYGLDLQDDRGGGASVNAKLHTLKLNHGWNFTSPYMTNAILEYLQSEGLGETPEVKEIFGANSALQLSPETADLLKQHNIAPYYGGIRVEYSDTIIFDDPSENREAYTQHGRGTLTIVFSGTNSELDAFFAMSALRYVCLATTRHAKHHYFSYKLEELQYDGVLDFWIRQLYLDEL